MVEGRDGGGGGIRTVHIYIHSCRHIQFSGHEPIYFIENKEKTLQASYDRDTQIVDYMD
jgi:hypothetical protein